MKKIRYILEYILVKSWLTLLRFLPLEQASNFGSKLFRFIGMKLKVSQTAYQNIKMIFPELNDLEIKNIILDVWDNFGRMSAETPIFLSMSKENLAQHVNITGIENFYKVKDKRAIFFTAHMANWEVASKALNAHGTRFHAVYRAANNKLVDNLINNDIRAKIDMPLIPKGKAGAKQVIATILAEQHIVMLIDQKMNDGIKVPFLGKDAMTAPAIASLALKYNCPIIPIHITRKNKYYFDIDILPQLELHKKDTKTIMIEINEIIGSWVRKTPGQWFWLHKRWIDS
ncbi:MAG: lipid A biosynthesis lauroyl acyltransferase [Pseudomonadota bacterium]